MDNELAGMTTQQKAELGCRRILRCLAHLSKEMQIVGIQDLQKCYLRVYKREFNKEECRALFGQRHVRPIFQKFFADTIKLSTDTEKTGSLYLELLCRIEDALGEEIPIEDLLKAESISNTADWVKKAIAVNQSKESKTKSTTAKRNGGTSKSGPNLDISDDEEEEKKVESAEKNSVKEQIVKKGKEGEKKVEEAEKNSVKSGKEGRRGILANEKVKEKSSSKEEEIKKCDRPISKSEGELFGALEDNGEEGEEVFEGDDDGEEDEDWGDEEDEYEDEGEYQEEEEEEKLEENELKTHLELLATIFVYVRMESPLKVTDLFGRLLSMSKNFKSPLDLVKFVQANNCNNAIIVQKCGNEDFLVWNTKATEVTSAIGHVMQKLGKILMDSKNGK